MLRQKKLLLFISVIIIIGTIFYGYLLREKNTDHTLARKIFDVLNKHRITYDIDACAVDPEFNKTDQPTSGEPEFIEHITSFIKSNKPISMFLVGFPFKSANVEKKTIGYLPDMAERVSFEYLQSIINEINAVYASGAKLIIFCDGPEFAPVFGISYDTVIAYEKALKALVSDLPGISLYTSADFMREHNLSKIEAINELIDTYAPKDQVIKNPTQPLSDITRKRVTLELDHAAGRTFLSQKSLDDVVSDLSKRDAALRNFIAKLMAERKFLRLTVHFSGEINKKFGIYLYPNSCVTPYHGVLVEELDGSKLIKFKKDVPLERYKLTNKTINGIDCFYFKRF